MKLYELSAQYNDFLYLLDNEVEMDEQTINDTLESIQASFDDKCESIALMCKQLAIEADGIEAEAKSLEARARSKRKTIEHLRDYVAANMRSIGQDRLETSRCKLTFRRSESVSIYDEQRLYCACKASGIDGLCEKVESVKFNKAEIKKALKDGVALDGAIIDSKQNLQIK